MAAKPLPRIDVNFTSPAIRDFIERVPELADARADAVDRYRARLETMTRDQILTALDGDDQKLRPIPNAAKLSKKDLINEAAKAYADINDAGREICRLRMRADADRMMAEKVNKVIDRAEETWAGLREQDGIYDADYQLERTCEDFRIQVALVRDYMREIVRAVARGEDIHTAARTLLMRAVKEVAGFPPSMHGDIGSGHRRIIAAQAAKKFVGEYAWSYGALGEEELAVNLALMI